MNVDVRPFSLPLARPLETASGPIERRDGFLVVVAADGVAGTGEATPLPGWTESHETCRAELDAAVDSLADLSPEEVSEDRTTLLTDPHATPAARHGLDLAIEDYLARRKETPLYRHLGADERVDSVPLNAVLGEGTRQETVAAAEAAASAGFDCLKLKVGSSDVETDVARVSAVRQAVGAGPTLRVDANGAWSRDEARRALDALRAADVEYAEQPLPADDLDGCADLRGGPVGVAVDETLARYGPEEVLEAGAADVFVIKPMVLGGPSRARAVAEVARGAGVEPVVTTTVDGVVARVGAVHVAASLPAPAPAGLATGDRLTEDLAPEPVSVGGGRASVPQTAGHGVDVRGDAA